MKIPCTNCNQHLEIPEELAGQTIECPACNESLDVPATAAKPPAPIQQSAPQVAASEKPKSSKLKLAIAAVAGTAVVVIASIIFFSDTKIEPVTEASDILRAHGAKTSESSDHSGNYILEANDIIVPTTLELKPDGSFIGTSSGKMIGSWKVDGDLLVCEASSTKTVIKFNKASGKLNSFSFDGNEMPWKRLLAEEGQDGLYFKKN